MNAADSFEVDGAVLEGWRALDASMRCSVCAFLCGSVRECHRSANPPRGIDGTSLPEQFACDLAAGGPLFRAAFPVLARRVIDITHSADVVEIRVLCEGEQRGSFFGLIAATDRAVRFVEVHAFALSSSGAGKDAVAIDVRAIVGQLGSRAARRHPVP